MMKYALYDYIPQRRLRRTTFEQQDINRLILDFKDGRNYASRWAARAMSRTLSAMDLSDVVVVCIPAASSYSTCRRYKTFSSMLCQMCNAVNGYDYVSVVGTRSKLHLSKNRQQRNDQLENVCLDAEFFKGKKVLLIDDICTTCKSANRFADMMQQAGATVVMQLFLAKTKSYYC